MATQRASVPAESFSPGAESICLGSLSQDLAAQSQVEQGAQPTPAPVDSQHVLEKWNRPRKNIPRLTFAFFSFMVSGMNDAVVGALLPYLEVYYDLSYTIVSLVFLTPFAGYALAAFTSARIHQKLGQRGVVILASIAHLITYIVLSNHPPYPVLIVFNMLSGFGNGLYDACFCAWIGSMDKANGIQGLLHSHYSFGALFAPLIATSMIVNAGLAWYTYYYVMVGFAVLELVGHTIFFWDKTALAYQRDSNNEAVAAGTKEAFKYRVTWFAALYFFTYMGIEVGLGGWVVSYMLQVRQASPYDAGISASAFWAGQTLGRAGLGFVIERYGERICITIFLLLCIVFQLVFWLAPVFTASIVAVAFLGVFLGPLFPAAVMIAAKLLPKHIHVSAIGFGMAIGGTGGTIFPFLIGAIAARAGVQVLQPILLALILVILIIWLSFPRIQKRD